MRESDFFDEVSDQMAMDGHISAHAEALGICSGMADQEYGAARTHNGTHFTTYKPTGYFVFKGATIHVDYNREPGEVFIQECPPRKLTKEEKAEWKDLYQKLCDTLLSEANRLIDEDDGGELTAMGDVIREISEEVGETYTKVESFIANYVQANRDDIIALYKEDREVCK